MRHALAIASTLLAVCAACERPNDRDMQPNPGTGYTVQTTGAEIVGVDTRSATETPEPSGAQIAERLATQICSREVRCHAGTQMDECRRANLDRAMTELRGWRCSPAGARARAEECLAAIGHEPCEYDLASRAALCRKNEQCGLTEALPETAP